MNPQRLLQLTEADTIPRVSSHKPVGTCLRRRWAFLGATLLALIFPLVLVSWAQAAGPEWKLTVTPDADYFLPDTAEAIDNSAVYTIEAENVGDSPTSNSEPIIVRNIPPDGLVPFAGKAIKFFYGGTGKSSEHGLITAEPPYVDKNELSAVLCPTASECVFPGPLAGSVPSGVSPGQRLIMLVRLAVPSSAPTGSIEDRVEISGGGAPTAEASTVNEVNPLPPYGLDGFSASLVDSSKVSRYTQAGGHPYQFSTEISFAQTTQIVSEEANAWGRSGIAPVHDPQNASVELPPGLLANPQGVPRCVLAAFFASECSASTVVGTVGFRGFGKYGSAFIQLVPLFNLQPTGAFPGELGFVVAGSQDFVITAGLRSATDYGVTAASSGLLPVGLSRVGVTIWGVPADPSHDGLRDRVCTGESRTAVGGFELRFANDPELIYRECESEPGGISAEAEQAAFLTLPTECSSQPLSFALSSNPYQNPVEEARALDSLPPVDGCSQLHFAPAIEAHPTTNLADSPSGLDFILKVPQNLTPEGTEDPNGLATADLKEAVVKLPPGLVINPSSAGGLGACGPEQVGLTTPVGSTPAHFTEAPARCPDASKLGTVEVKTQLLHSPLQGSVYLATPHQNPSGNLLAGYIVLEGEGVIIKLAGQFQANPQTGQITASFLENPQTPFKEFKFHFFEGARGALRTPATCGTYEVGSVLTPYSWPESGPPAEPTAEFETTAGPTGGACPGAAGEEPNQPTFHAGTESPAAGIYSPFSLRLVRQDGEQEIKGIETTLPEGLVGRLAGVAECSDAAIAAAAGKSGAAEQASPSCPATSEVGTVDVASGAGPTPIHVPGRVYLAGPYKGAPLSLAIITPAVAGPFDLGTVVVRTALFVDPLTTQITAKSDPIPTILEGIPLDVRAITVQMSRPSFTLNPTDCEPKQITGSALTVLGRSASLAQRFQVGGCQALGFKPSLKIALKGSTKHAGHPALEAVVTYPQSGPYANIAAAQVNLPSSEFIDQGNLNKTCTRPVLLEGKCPATSVYGKVKAWTPLLEKPLEGPVYLVGGFGYKLPALVAELNGQIRVLLVGKVDSGANHGIRNTFETVPDAPVSRFVLQMKGGKKYSLLENSENICAKPQKATATFTAQSGKVVTLEPAIANSCKGKKKGKKGKGHGKGHRRHDARSITVAGLGALRGW